MQDTKHEAGVTPRHQPPGSSMIFPVGTETVASDCPTNLPSSGYDRPRFSDGPKCS